MKAKLLILLFFTFLIIPISEAAKIKPANISDEELMERIKNDPPDEVKVSFWELPLWIKIHHVVTITLAALGIWKFLPFAITKIKSALASRKRERILKFVEANPGASMKEIEDALRISRSTLRHHIDTLEKEGLLMTVRAGKERLVFPVATLSDTGLKMVTALKSDVRQRIMELLIENGGLSIKELAELLGLNYKTVHYHLRILKEAGAVDMRGGFVQASTGLKK